jgi:hypothetical protein
VTVRTGSVTPAARSTGRSLAAGPQARGEILGQDFHCNLAEVHLNTIDPKDLHAQAVKVVTERGVVHLMGRVTQREADRATQIARAVPGVTKVVRVFEILTEAELATLEQSQGLKR